jgi:hypothetical protein
MQSEEQGRTEFERILADLEGLTPAQVGERVAAHVAPEDAAKFSIATQNLSPDALRFLAARVLLRLGSQKLGQRGNPSP